MSGMNEHIKNWYDTHAAEVEALAKKIWSRPEPAMAEFESCRVMAAFMREQGFDVKTFHCQDPSKADNTVVATWGQGRPVIGISANTTRCRGWVRTRCRIPRLSRATGTAADTV